MPNFKENTSPAMKRSGFKMKGYSYPGTSPAKNTTKKKQWYVDNYEAKKDKPGFLDAMNKAFESEKKGEVTVKGKTTTQKYTA